MMVNYRDEFISVGRIIQVCNRVESIRSEVFPHLLLKSLEITVSLELGVQPLGAVREALGLSRDRVGSTLVGVDQLWIWIF